jgi:hypothetical protein
MVTLYDFLELSSPLFSFDTMMTFVERRHR